MIYNYSPLLVTLYRYKYLLKSKKNTGYVWEDGPNRVISEMYYEEESNLYIRQDGPFRVRLSGILFTYILSLYLSISILSTSTI